MKTYIILLLSGTLFLTASSFNAGNANKQLKKDGYVFVQSDDFEMFDDLSIQKGFYISKAEITNKQYRDFLSDLTANGKTGELKVATVDTMSWNSIGGHLDPYVEYYHKHPAYYDYPVVTISFEAAQLYCNGLTEKYRKQGFNVTVTLPTEHQWIFAACGGQVENKYGFTGDALTDKKGNYKANFKGMADGGIFMSPSVSFKPNAFGIYNMSGNVAEMLNEQGKFKGGHFWSEEEFMPISASDEFETGQGPSPYIGFRPVIMIN